MIGTLINTGAIVAGGLFGHLFGKALKERHQETLTMACGVGTLFIGISGALNFMLHHDLFPNGGSMLATAIKPVMTETAMGYLSLVGNVLIFCVGVNLVWGKKIRVANLLPAVFLAVAAAFLPVGFF